MDIWIWVSILRLSLQNGAACCFSFSWYTCFLNVQSQNAWYFFLVAHSSIGISSYAQPLLTSYSNRAFAGWLFQNGSLRPVISIAVKFLRYFSKFCSSSFNLDHILLEWKRRKIVSRTVKTVVHTANYSAVSFSTLWNYFLNADYS